MYLIQIREENNFFNKNAVYFAADEKELNVFKSFNIRFQFFSCKKNDFTKLPEKINEFWICRHGGIGDVLALTSLINYFKHYCDKFRIATSENNKGLFDWINYDCDFLPIRKDMSENPTIEYILSKKPVKDYINPKEFENYCNNIIFYVGEGTYELETNKNWYEVFFKDITLDSKFFRPFLKTQRINSDVSNIIPDIPSILVCNSASSQPRTTHFTAIYSAIKDFKGIVYCYDIQLTNLDRRTKFPKNVRIIKPCLLETYFLDLYDADLVITVDSSALHFREGIEKPAIGLFTSFTAECRTLYYKFTQSFNLQSGCDLQPCFKHIHTAGEVCNKVTKGFEFAPCLIGQSFINQVRNIYENYRK